MSISHVYKSYEVIRHDQREHEVPALGMTLPSEAAAHAAIESALSDWLDGYDKVTGTPSDPVAKAPDPYP